MSPHVTWYLSQRARAAELGDVMLVMEIDAALARLGYVETSVPDLALERAVPVKRKPGRPRKILLEDTK